MVRNNLTNEQNNKNIAIKGNLTNEQNVRSAIVFLNTFGLKLEGQSNLNQDSKIGIINSSDEQVGELYFEDDLVKIKALSAFGELEAEYKKSNYKGFTDVDSGGARFANWENVIDYSIKKNERERFGGKVFLNSYVDEEFGYGLALHTLLQYFVDDRESLTIRFQMDGNLFKIFINGIKATEEICFNLFGVKGLELIHKTSSGKFDEKSGEYLDKETFYAMEQGGMSDDSDNIIVRKAIFKNGKLDFVDDVAVEKIKDSNDDSKNIQKGLLMQKANLAMVKTIAKVRCLLTNGDVDLLNNLINVSYQNYNDDEIFALFGINRIPLTYQNGDSDLREAYFGIKNENVFLLSSDTQKKLTKNVSE